MNIKINKFGNIVNQSWKKNVVNVINCIWKGEGGCKIFLADVNTLNEVHLKPLEIF